MTDETAQSSSAEEDRPSMSKIAAWLDAQPRVLLTIYAIVAAFAAYASMYAFRKPFTAAEYKGLVAFSVAGVSFSYKSIAVISQLFGYMCSKFIGIKVTSEASYNRRVPLVLAYIGFAELMLVFFGLVPQPWNIVFLFFNGLPLGMVWSLLFGLLEGRRLTEVLGLGMSISVIFSSDWVKAVGRFTMEQWGVTQFWMPSITGLLFVPVLLISLWMLFHIPPPDKEDIAQRTKRVPMDRKQRHAFMFQYFPGVAMMIVGYLALMTYRALRDDYMPDILENLGHKVNAGTFAGIGTIVGLTVTVFLCSLWFFRDNRHAVWAQLVMIAIGPLILGFATIEIRAGRISPVMFYLLNGIGLYIAYIPFQIIWERLIASLHTMATVSFLIAMADSFGYLSTVAMYLTRDIYATYMNVEVPWESLLMYISYVIMVIVPMTAAGAALYFNKHMRA